MKIACKCCNKVLTDDLYPMNPRTNKHGKWTNYKIWKRPAPYQVTIVDPDTHEPLKDLDGNDVVYTEHEDPKFRKGIFVAYKYPSKDYKYCPEEGDEQVGNYHRVIKGDFYLFVSADSIVAGVIPPFKQGYGCCNWSMGEPLHCECGNLLGEMRLDCYEDGNVAFYQKNVLRVYK